MDVYNLDGSNIFKEGEISVVVSRNEHHGKHSLHSHSFYEFVFIKKGFSLHTFNDLTSILTSGDVFAIRPGDRHGYTSANHASIYNCLFRKEALDMLQEGICSLPGIAGILGGGLQTGWTRIHLDIKSRTLAEKLLENMITEGEERKPGWEINLLCLLSEFLILFARAYTKNYGGNEDSGYKYYRHVFNALSYIESNYAENISVNDIASHTGLSPDYMSRQFRQFTGMTTVKYIRSYRFAKAVEMLKETDKPVSDIAFDVGIDDPSYFTREFKRILGINPSEYRRTNSG